MPARLAALSCQRTIRLDRFNTPISEIGPIHIDRGSTDSDLGHDGDNPPCFPSSSSLVYPLEPPREVNTTGACAMPWSPGIHYPLRMEERRWWSTVSSFPEYVRGMSPARQSVTVALVITLFAAMPRLAGLARWTPGFRIEEASLALMAQRVERGNLPIFFGTGQDAILPFFPYLVKVTGAIGGWGVFAPRLAAALCGIAAAVFVALWLVRALGPWWGLAGGLLVATSFWQIMFSRQALAPASAAMFASLGLWLAWIGLDRGMRQPSLKILRRRDLPWYIAAGVAFGLGFYTDPGYTVVPAVVLLTSGLLAFNQQRSRPDADALGPALLILTMVIVMTPLAGYFLEYPQDFRRSLDLAAGLPDDLANTGDDVASGLLGLGWDGSERPEVNLPGRPLLDPILVFWALAGLVAALRHPIRAFEGTLLIWLAAGVFAIGLAGGNDPALYLSLTPVIFALPVLGMRAIWRLAGSRDRRFGRAAVMVIVLSVAASAGWSSYAYFWQWTGSVETYEAMRGDVRDAIDALAELPDDDIPVYVAAGDAGRIVRYLAPERARHDVESLDQISLAVDDDAYLIAPRSTQPVPQLRVYLSRDDLVQTGSGADGETAYRIWLVGPRTRETLPYAVPAIPFENGWSLPGFDARAAPTRVGAQPEIEVVLLWEVPRDADPYTVEVRLVPTGNPARDAITTANVEVHPWKHPEIDGGEYLLVYAQLPFPDSPDQTASLQVGLRDPSTGEISPALLNAQDGGYAFLNDLHIVLP